MGVEITMSPNGTETKTGTSSSSENTGLITVSPIRISENIQFENETVRGAFETFVKNYKEPICQFLNTFLKTEGYPVDSFISVTDDTITIYQTAPDKGEVLFREEGSTTLTLGGYLSIPVGSTYATIESGSLWLFLKEAEGEPDIKVGQFKNLNDAVKDWDSDSVKDALKQVREFQEKLKSGRTKGDKKN